MLTLEQLKMRKQLLTATDAPKIVLPEHPWGTPLTVYTDKVSPDIERFEPNEAMWMGTSLELPIACRYAKENNVQIIDGTTLQHPTHQWMGATPDFMWKNDPKHLVECKAVLPQNRQLWGPEGTDKVPSIYYVQCMWQMLVCEATVCDVVCAIVGQDFKVYRIERDPEMEQNLFEACYKFWTDHVLKKVPPPARGTEDRSEFLKRMYKKNNGNLIQATPTMKAAIDHYVACRDVLKITTERFDDAKSIVQDHIHEFDGIEIDRDYRVTWKCNKDSPATDWKSVAMELKAPQEVIAKYTVMKAGPRVLRVHKKEAKDE
jgi:putative phage-type endonuclease